MIETPISARFYNIAGWDKVYISVYTGTMPIIKEKELTKSNDGFTYNIKLYVPEIPEATDFSDFSVVYTDGEGNECKANWVGDGMTDLNGELPAPKLSTEWPTTGLNNGDIVEWTVEIGTINIETIYSPDAVKTLATSTDIPNWVIENEGKTARYTYPEGGDKNIYKLTAVLEGAQSDFFILDLSNGGVSGITDVDADNNAEAVYFNLQGVRVAGELTPGMYICRQGDKVSKVVVR